jgi:hypothetical protein
MEFSNINGSVKIVDPDNYKCADTHVTLFDRSSSRRYTTSQKGDKGITTVDVGMGRVGQTETGKEPSTSLHR